MTESASPRSWIISFLILALAVLIGAVALWSTRPQPVEITILPPAPSATPAPSPTPGPVTVYVTGAVGQPETLIALPAGSRVEDALAAAGGALPDADLTRVNLAARVRDGDQIHVPRAGEAAPLATPNIVTVYINRATLEELDTLPGVGPELAAAIIAWREAEGPFLSLDDLDAVEGVGPRLLEDLAPLVNFEVDS